MCLFFFSYFTVTKMTVIEVQKTQTLLGFALGVCDCYVEYGKFLNISKFLLTPDNSPGKRIRKVQGLNEQRQNCRKFI